MLLEGKPHLGASPSLSGQPTIAQHFNAGFPPPKPAESRRDGRTRASFSSCLVWRRESTRVLSGRVSFLLGRFHRAALRLPWAGSRQPFRLGRSAPDRCDTWPAEPRAMQSRTQRQTCGSVCSTVPGRDPIGLIALDDGCRAAQRAAVYQPRASSRSERRPGSAAPIEPTRPEGARVEIPAHPAAPPFRQSADKPNHDALPPAPPTRDIRARGIHAP